MSNEAQIDFDFLQDHLSDFDASLRAELYARQITKKQFLDYQKLQQSFIAEAADILGLEV